jgi:hypothetical protein
MGAIFAFVSLLAGAVVFLLGRQIVTVVGHNAAARVRETEAPAAPAGSPLRRPSVFSAFGAAVVRYAPKVAQGLESDLYWSAFLAAYNRGEGGIVAHVDPSEVSLVLGRQLLMSALLGVAALAAFKSNLGLAAGFAFGWWLTRTDLRSRAEHVKSRISQELPEFVQIMAAESASGAALDDILHRAAEGRSMVAHWVKGVLSLSGGRTLLQPIPEDPNGLLHFEALRSGHLPLALLAIQLGYATSGVQIRPLMESLSRSYSNDFVSQASIRAEKLGNTLGMATALFYAIPFLFAVLAVVGMPLLKVLFG